MTRIANIAYFTLTALAATGLVLAQDQPQNQSSQPPDRQMTQPAPAQNNNHGWRRADDPAPADATAAEPQNDQNPGSPQQAPQQAPQPGYYAGQPAPPPNYGAQQAAPPPNYGGYQGQPPNYGAYPGPRPNYQQMPPNQRTQAPPPPIPSSLTIKPGTYLTVRVNQVLSSDHNHVGDAFAATLVKPVVIDGVVVAERGQTIGGRVAEAKKAGMVEGVSKLGLQLTDMTLVDGQNLPIQSQLISRDGPTSVGRDAAAIGGTTAVGAAAGAAADLGRGAAIGAGAGAVVGIVGVLLTRGRPTLIYPEQVLTFKLEAPVTIATDHAPQAFRYAGPGDYQQADMQRRGPPTMGVSGGPAPYYAPGYYAPAPYYYGPAYYPGYYPYSYGPGIGLYYGGRGYYGGRR